jgi:spore coat polysaccharide biosynthesis protein SpsF (cytidylyltransferase family)
MYKFYKNKNFGLIIISSLKSKRLKNKVILKINSRYSLTEYLINKIKYFFKNTKIILATSKKKNDKKLIQIAKKKNINFFAGNLIDVLNRIYNASKEYKLTNILVCSGDNPLIDLEQMNKLIKFHLKENNDFSSYKNMPLGTYGWVLKVKSLKKIIKLKKIKNTEIWGNFFLENKSLKCKFLNYRTKKKFLFYKRLTIDTSKDLLLVRKILKIAKRKYPNLKDIEKILYRNPNLLKINNNIVQRVGPRNVY